MMLGKALILAQKSMTTPWGFSQQFSSSTGITLTGGASVSGGLLNVPFGGKAVISTGKTLGRGVWIEIRMKTTSNGDWCGLGVWLAQSSATPVGYACGIEWDEEEFTYLVVHEDNTPIDFTMDPDERALNYLTYRLEIPTTGPILIKENGVTRLSFSDSTVNVFDFIVIKSLVGTDGYSGYVDWITGGEL